MPKNFIDSITQAEQPAEPEYRSKFTFSAIAEYADRVRYRNTLDDDLAMDYNAIVRNLGGEVSYHPLTPLLWINGIGDFVIGLHPNLDRKKKRFYVAKAVGHYFLHWRSPETMIGQPRIVFEIKSFKAADDQAKVFATCLLVPLNPFNELRQRMCREQLAEKFGVSETVIDNRASLIDRKVPESAQ